MNWTDTYDVGIYYNVYARFSNTTAFKLYQAQVNDTQIVFENVYNQTWVELYVTTIDSFSFIESAPSQNVSFFIDGVNPLSNDLSTISALLFSAKAQYQIFNEIFSLYNASNFTNSGYSSVVYPFFAQLLVRQKAQMNLLEQYLSGRNHSYPTYDDCTFDVFWNNDNSGFGPTELPVMEFLEIMAEINEFAVDGLGDAVSSFTNPDLISLAVRLAISQMDIVAMLIEVATNETFVVQYSGPQEGYYDQMFNGLTIQQEDVIFTTLLSSCPHVIPVPLIRPSGQILNVPNSGNNITTSVAVFARPEDVLPYTYNQIAQDNQILTYFTQMNDYMSQVYNLAGNFPIVYSNYAFGDKETSIDVLNSMQAAAAWFASDMNTTLIARDGYANPNGVVSSPFCLTSNAGYVSFVNITNMTDYYNLLQQTVQYATYSFAYLIPNITDVNLQYRLATSVTVWGRQLVYVNTLYTDAFRLPSSTHRERRRRYRRVRRDVHRRQLLSSRGDIFPRTSSTRLQMMRCWHDGWAVAMMV